MFAMKLEESIKTIFYLPHYASLLKSANLKTEHTHFSKMCLLKRAVLYKKLNFRVFESSNIRNKNEQVNKSHFLSYTAYLSINLSKSKTFQSTVQNCVYSKLLFWLKSNLQEPLTNQTLKKSVNEPLKPFSIFHTKHRF